MRPALKFTSMASLPGRSSFVLVNGRVPRLDANCALCCKRIEQGYVREFQTGLVYCTAQCFFGHKGWRFSPSRTA